MRDVSIRRFGLAVVTSLVTIGCVGLPGPVAVGAVPTSVSADVGFAARVETHPPAPTRPPIARSKGTRRIPRTAAVPQGPGVAPAVASAAAANIGAVTLNANGVGSRDSAVTNFNAEFEPPDQALCVGNGYVLEAVNSAYSVYNTAGRLVRGPFNVNDLFNEGAQEFTSDPRCYFDPATHTWFATILFINSANNDSRIDLAVNTSGDPTGPWAHYRIDTADDGRNGEPSRNGCPCLGDQPTLGIDADNVYITTNEFSLVGPQYHGAQIYAVARTDLAAGRAAAHVAHLGHLSAGGAVASSVQPALTTGPSPAEYFLSSLDPNGTFDSRVAVWALTDQGAVAAGGTPTLSDVVVQSETYGVPPASPQKGSTSRLDSGDDRMQQVQYIGGTLWGELTTGVTIPGDVAQRAGAAWFGVTPTVAGGVVSRAAVTQQGYVTRSGDSVLYPALQADAAGRAAMVFTLVGADNYPSAAYATLTAGAASFSSPKVSAAGTGPYDPTATRWGDYSFAVVDPSVDAVWGATEYVPPLGSQTLDHRRNWGTRYVRISLS